MQAYQTLVQQRQQMSSRCISTPGPPLPPIPKSLCGLHIDLQSRQVSDPSMMRLAGMLSLKNSTSCLHVSLP